MDGRLGCNAQIFQGGILVCSGGEMFACMDETNPLRCGISAERDEVAEGGDGCAFDDWEGDGFTGKEFDEDGEGLFGLEDGGLLSLGG